MRKINHYLILLLVITMGVTLDSCKGSGEDEPVERLELSLHSVAGDSVELTWEMSDDSQFDSYELYRHNSSGIDRETGTFIHVETDQSKNSFTDHGLDALQTYYYRLYHVNEAGSSKGSNVIEATTPTKELIANGSFESKENNVPSEWTLTANELGNPNNSIELVAESSHGNRALKIHHAEENGCWEQWITQQLDLDDLTPGQKYVLTFDYKADFNLSAVNIILRNSTLDIWDYETISYQPAQSWQTMTYEMVMPSDIGSNDPSFQIHFCQEGLHSIWIDNVSMKQSE